MYFVYYVYVYYVYCSRHSAGSGIYVLCELQQGYCSIRHLLCVLQQVYCVSSSCVLRVLQQVYCSIRYLHVLCVYCSKFTAVFGIHYRCVLLYSR
jgi:hypothetical protein